jgi:hypothetical protein
MRDKQGMWLHYCHSDQGWWYTIGPDEECTWCGRVEEDEPSHFLMAPPLQNMDADQRSRADSLRT